MQQNDRDASQGMAPRPSSLHAAGAWGALLAGAVLFALGLWGYQSGETLSEIDYWWIACLGLAGLTIGALLHLGWVASGFLGGLYIAGFSAQLALKDPFWFQQFQFGGAELALAMLAAVGLQGLVGGLYLLRAGALRHLGQIGGSLGWFRLFLVAMVLIAGSKAAMEFIALDDMPRYAKQLVIALGFLACNLVGLTAFLVALPGDALGRAGVRFRRLVALAGDPKPVSALDARLPLILAGFVFVVCASISLWSFDGVPHLDGIVYLFHARYFADGVLTLPIPAGVEAFNHYLMDIRGDRWFSVNLPGWPAALAIGIWLGVPWLINPVLAGISVLLLHRFLRVQTDRGTANLTTFLLAISPWYLSMSSTMLIHTFAYTMILGAWVLLQRSRTEPGLVAPLLAGCLMGWLFLARPLEGVYMGVLTGIWTLSFLTDRRQWRTVIMYGLGCFAVGVLLFFNNRALTGSATLMPIKAYLDEFWGPGRNDMGFGPHIGAPDWGNVDVFDGHSPIEALINFHQNFYELNMDLLGWGGASVLFALVFVLWGRWTRFTAAMAVIVALTFFIYALYWYAGGFYAGPRYWFLAIVPMLIFSALGLRRFAEMLHGIYPEAHVAERVAAMVILLGASSVLVYESWLALNKYPDINGYHADYLKLSRKEEFRNALVYIRSDEPESEYGSAFWLNDFAPDAETPLFAKDLGPESNREVAAGYPDRQIYVVEARSVEYPVVTVVQGPVSSVEALE